MQFKEMEEQLQAIEAGQERRILGGLWVLLITLTVALVWSVGRLLGTLA